MSELLAFLEKRRREKAPEDGAMTFRELMKALGVGKGKLYRMLHDLADDGRLRTVTVQRETLSGNLQPSPAYILVDESDDSDEGER